MQPTLVLSSSSPARRALLSRLPITFSSTSPDVDETPLPDETVETMVRRLAQLKAEKSAANYPDALIIGCDQAGIIDGHILCKPLTHENAVKQLRLVSGKTVRFFTAVCLLDNRNQHVQSSIETYDVHFRMLTDTMIEGYLQKEKPYQCAGSFQAEGLGIAIIDKFHGDDYTALIGLPLIRLTQMLENAGVNLLST